jgi:hypothetical protein
LPGCGLACVCLALAALGFCPGAVVLGQIPEGWEVVRVTNDSFYDGPPAINCMGQVVWSKRLAGFDGEEIFMRDIDGTVIRITNDNVRDAFPDINDDGVIVWSRAVGPGGRFEIAMHRDGETRLLTNNGRMNWGPRINNRGHVVWGQETDRGCYGLRIMLQDEQGTRAVYDEQYSNQIPFINDLGEIVWTRYDFCQNPWRGTPMYRKPNGEIIELTDGSDQSQAPYFNNSTEIVYWVPPDGIILWDNGERRWVTDWGTASDISDHGVISVNRWHDDIGAWQQWLWMDGEFLRLSDDLEWNRSGELNTCGELAWLRGPSLRAEIVVLQWKSTNGDITADGIVDSDDWAAFAPCLAGPVRSVDDCACHRTDLDHNGIVDLRDFAHLQGAFGDSP